MCGLVATMVLLSIGGIDMGRTAKVTKVDLVKLYVHQKLSAREVAEKVGLSTPAIFSALKRHDIPRRSLKESARLNRSHSDQNWNQLRKKYELGSPLEDVAEEVGCALSTAAQYLREAGASIRHRGAETNRGNSRGKIEIDMKKAIKWNQKGATLTEIAEKMGVSVQIVSKRLQESGYVVLVNKASTDEFKNVQVKKREVARAIGACKCVVCGERRGVQLCHIQARRKGGPLNPDNAIALCPSHHWFMDQGVLQRGELKKVVPHLESAALKGYQHHRYPCRRPT